MPPQLPEPRAIDLDETQMRKAGYRVVDLIVDHFLGVGDEPVGRALERAQAHALFGEPVPETPLPVSEVLDTVERDVLPHVFRLDHPRFFSFVPGATNFVSVLGDAIATGFNIFTSTWLEGSAAIEIELVTVRWLAELLGLPPSTGGLFVPGGSLANLTAMTVARDTLPRSDWPRAVAYCSDETHSCVRRSMRLLGFDDSQLRALPTSADGTLPAGLLHQRVLTDRAANLRPFLVIATAGTTNTGAIDPLPDIATICQEQNLWLHVDGAYGATAAITSRGRTALTGLEQADSITIDPHKWLFQPCDAACVLLRNPDQLRATFQGLPVVAQIADGSEEEVNLCEYGVQLTRRSYALKMWMALKTFGAAAFRTEVDRCIDLTLYAAAHINSRDDLHLVTPPSLSTVTFRYISPDTTRSATDMDLLQEAIAHKMITGGYAAVSHTTVNGDAVLRLCLVNPRTTEHDLTQTLEQVRRHGAALSDGTAARIKSPPA